MSLGMLIPRHVVSHTLAKFIVIEDLAQAQATDVQTRQAFEDLSVWWESTSAALPNFRLSQDLLSKGNRAEFMTLFKALLSTGFSPGVQVSLDTIAETRKVSRLLANANKAVAAHLGRGGSFAEVVITKLSFDPEKIGAAFEEAPLPGESGFRSGDTPLCIGTSVAVLGTSRTKEDGSPMPLRVHFAWQSGSLLVNARDDDLPSEAMERPQDPLGWWQEDDSKTFTLDVMSLSSAMTFNYRGVAMQTKAAWQQASSGIFAMTRGKVAARDALTNGVLCIMCVRDGAPEHSTYLAKTLHLDTPQR
mmetsp:Transcript_120533/g.384890  ORF Transcript_120533/g.384890 Transcript_120533/m.384890 type:complete len:304 (+) Transcript_120533:194-1105(+)